MLTEQSTLARSHDPQQSPLETVKQLPSFLDTLIGGTHTFLSTELGLSHVCAQWIRLVMGELLIKK